MSWGTLQDLPPVKFEEVEFRSPANNWPLQVQPRRVSHRKELYERIGRKLIWQALYWTNGCKSFIPIYEAMQASAAQGWRVGVAAPIREDQDFEDCYEASHWRCYPLMHEGKGKEIAAYLLVPREALAIFERAACSELNVSAISGSTRRESSGGSSTRTSSLAVHNHDRVPYRPDMEGPGQRPNGQNSTSERTQAVSYNVSGSRRKPGNSMQELTPVRFQHVNFHASSKYWPAWVESVRLSPEDGLHKLIGEQKIWQAGIWRGVALCFTPIFEALQDTGNYTWRMGIAAPAGEDKDFEVCYKPTQWRCFPLTCDERGKGIVGHLLVPREKLRVFERAAFIQLQGPSPTRAAPGRETSRESFSRASTPASPRRGRSLNRSSTDWPQQRSDSQSSTGASAWSNSSSGSSSTSSSRSASSSSDRSFSAISAGSRLRSVSHSPSALDRSRRSSFSIQ